MVSRLGDLAPAAADCLSDVTLVRRETLTSRRRRLHRHLDMRARCPRGRRARCRDLGERVARRRERGVVSARGGEALAATALAQAAVLGRLVGGTPARALCDLDIVGLRRVARAGRRGTPPYVLAAAALAVGAVAARIWRGRRRRGRDGVASPARLTVGDADAQPA